MRIGELAMVAEVDVETIRYYEKSGLLQHPPREANGYRNYGAQHADRLAFIRHCRGLDMPLASVKRLLDFVAHPEADCGGIDRLIEEQLVRVRERLNSMLALERQLVALRTQCAESRTARDCGILSELVSASHHEKPVAN